MERRTAVIIVAGGSGQRCGGGLPKQFRLLGGVPVLARTINRFAEALPGAETVVVLPGRYVEFWKNLAARFDVAPHAVVAGGAERSASVRCGAAALRSEPELIAVQDGVRPLASAELIRRVAQAAAERGAVVPAVEPADSFRTVDGDGSQPIDRGRLRAVQTPQVFRADWLLDAYRAERAGGFTDDASLVERSGHRICLVEGERTNIKLTTEEDFVVAEALLAARCAGEPSEERPEEPFEERPEEPSEAAPEETSGESIEQTPERAIPNKTPEDRAGGAACGSGQIP